jgi:hypothetical protein
MERKSARTPTNERETPICRKRQSDRQEREGLTEKGTNARTERGGGREGGIERERRQTELEREKAYRAGEIQGRNTHTQRIHTTHTHTHTHSV